MFSLLIVQPGLYGEALEPLLREAEPAMALRVLVGSAAEAIHDTPPVTPDLVVVEHDCLGADPRIALEAIRARAPEALLVVAGTPSDDAGDGYPAGIYCLRRVTGGDGIVNVIHDLLRQRTATSASPDAAPCADPSELRTDAVPTLDGFGLTPSETQVLAVMVEGKTNQEIAQALGKALGTVRTQVQSILRKLQVRNRSEAIAMATRIVAVVNSQIGDVDRKGLDITGLLPHMRHRIMREGTVLFRKGDESRHLFLLQRGRIRLEEFHATLGQNDTLGEIGIFAPDHLRTCTAVCETDVALFEIDAEKVRQAYFLNPQFALHIINKITTRLLADKVRTA